AGNLGDQAVGRQHPGDRPGSSAGVEHDLHGHPETQIGGTEYQSRQSDRHTEADGRTDAGGGPFHHHARTGYPGTSAVIQDLDGNLISTVATVDGVPDRPAVWVGADRVAYVDHGTLRIAGLHTPVSIKTTRVDHGSLAGSPDGQFLAAQTSDGSMVIDLATGASRTRLPQGASGFAWSTK